ncbi:MAG TPA: hypothetical protein VKQ52_02660, partial [Puia sp.]|nr:hypothetical protein [Puia sp.]
LRTFPMGGGSFGAVKGEFPAFTLNGDGVFTAYIGFLANTDPGFTTNILFQVFVYNPFDAPKIPQAVISITKSFSGGFLPVRADLSAFRNQPIKICVLVTSQPPSRGAAAYWLAPTITY